MEENVNFDNEVLAYLSVRKDELIESHSEYIAKHPEIREVLNDFLSSVLLSKPVSVSYARTNVNHCLERRLRLREGVLPPIQQNTSQAEATHSRRAIWCWKEDPHRLYPHPVWRSLREEEILHHQSEKRRKA